MDEKIKNSLVVFAWEEGKVSLPLRQLEELPGNSTNPKSYDYPVVFQRIEGATWETVVENPDPRVLKNMIREAKYYSDQGAGAILTSCGFNAIYQKKIAQEIDIPFYSSSLLQISFIQAVFGEEREIIVITANKDSLSKEHFVETGTKDLSNVTIYGMMEECQEWQNINSFERKMDLDKLREEIVHFSRRISKRHVKPGAILLECTDLPPFAKIFKEETGLPVFDYMTLANYAQSTINIKK